MTSEEEEKRPWTEEEERPPTPDDDMSFQYPKYGDDPDAEAHVYAFQQTWEANHVSQVLTAVEAECSQMAEFGMTLEGPATRWHLTQDPSTITTFEALKIKCLHFFTKRWINEKWSAYFIPSGRSPRRTFNNS